MKTIKEIVLVNQESPLEGLQKNRNFIWVMLVNNPDLPKCTITSDTTWAYGCDVKMKAQSSLWKLSEEQIQKEQVMPGQM